MVKRLRNFTVATALGILLSMAAVNAQGTKTMLTTASLNVRSGPGTKFAVLGSYAKNTTISVIGIENGWAKISFNGRTAYLSESHLKDQSNGQLVVDTNKTMKTTANLNVRSGAGTSHSILGSFSKGTTLKVIAINNGWAQVSYQGKKAYCSIQYLEEVKTEAPVEATKPVETKKLVENPKPIDTSTTMEITTYVNVRKGAGTQYQKLGMLSPKETVKVTSIANGWAKITYKNQVAYVSSEYLRSVAPKPKEETADKVMKSTTWLNVRKSTSIASESLGLLSPEEEVKVISIYNGWAKIDYKSQIAYCSTSYLQEVKTPVETPQKPVKPKTPETPVVPETPKSPDVPTAPVNPPAAEAPAVSETPVAPKPVIKEISDTISINASSLNIRKGPGTDYETLGSVAKGNTLSRTGIHENGWSRVVYNGQEGYVSSEYVVKITADKYSNTMYHYKKAVGFTIDSFITGQLTKTNISLKKENINGTTLNTYMNPELIENKGRMYQFLTLNKFRDNVKAEELNKYLNSLSYNTFHGQGQGFIDAAREYNIDTLYLVAHTILETGYGKSTLARGVDYEVAIPVAASNAENSQGVESLEGITEKKIVRVYNLFGIGAIDSNPLGGGASTAYKNGWTSIELAIKGGAQWIAQNYIHSTKANQHQYTVYMMRWNTNGYRSAQSNVIWHQYATDIAWADSIAALMNQLSYIYNNATLELEIPSYK